MDGSLMMDGGVTGSPSGPEMDALTCWVVRGDRQALAGIIDAHQDGAYGLALQITGDHAQAEDAVQEAFLAVALKARQFSQTASLRSWILAIVANCARQQLRRARRRRRHEQLAARAAAHAHATGSETSVTSGEDDARAAVAQELGRLPAHEREAVFLRCVEGLSFQEVATALRIREPAARKRVGRGLGRLRAALGGERARDEGVLLSLLTVAHPPRLQRLGTTIAGHATWTAPGALGGSALIALAGLVLAAGLGVGAGIVVAHWAHGAPAATLRSAPAAAAALSPGALPGPVGDRPIADLLDLPIAVELRQTTLPGGMYQIARALPPRRRLAWAAPADWAMEAKPEPLRATLPAGTRTIRAVLDALAAQLQLQWVPARDVICFTKSWPPARSQALQERFLHPQPLVVTIDDQVITLSSADCQRGAALAMAQSVERSCLRLLLLHVGDNDAATAAAARGAVRSLVGDPSDDGSGEFLAPLALYGEDPAVQQALAVWHGASGDRDVAFIDVVAACRLRSALPWLVPLAADLGHEPPLASRFTAPLVSSDIPGGELYTSPPMAMSIADHAIIALGRLGDRRALPVLLQDLAACHDRCALRLLAVALCRIGDPAALPALLARQRTLEQAPPTPGLVPSWYPQPLFDTLGLLDVDQASADALAVLARDPATGSGLVLPGGSVHELTQRLAAQADAGHVPDCSQYDDLEREPRLERPLLAQLKVQATPGWPLLLSLTTVGGEATVVALQERALRPGAEALPIANALSCMALPSAATAFRVVAGAYLERGPAAIRVVADQLLTANDAASQALVAHALAVGRPPAWRLAFMQGCDRFWPPRAVPLLITLLQQDPDPAIRHAAYTGLFDISMDDATATGLRSAQDPFLRAVGVEHEAHGELLACLAVLPDLLHAASDPSSEVRCAALGLLVRLLAADVPGTPPVLAQALRHWFSAVHRSDPSAEVQAWAQQGLQVLGTSKSPVIPAF